MMTKNAYNITIYLFILTLISSLKHIVCFVPENGISLEIVSNEDERLGKSGLILRTCRIKYGELPDTISSPIFVWLGPNREVIDRGSVLRIDITPMTLPGTYICQLKDTATQKLIVSTNFILSEDILGQDETILNTRTTQTKRVEAGHNAILNCSLYFQKPVEFSSIEYRWFSGKNILVRQDILTIPELQVNVDTGTYTCNVTTTFEGGKKEYFTMDVKLIVYDPNDASSEVSTQFGEKTIPIDVKVYHLGVDLTNNKEVNKFESQDLSLECKVTSSEVKENELMTEWVYPNGPKVSGRTLHIQSIRKTENKGTYKCIGRHNATNSEASASVNVVVHDLPLLITPQTNERLEPGGLISRHCKIDFPDSYIKEPFDTYWFDTKLNYLDNRNPMLLPIPLKDYANFTGFYRCRVKGRNSGIISEKYFQVNITENPIEYSLNLKQDPDPVDLGSPMKLLANVLPLNIEQKQFYWYKENKLISDKPELLFDSFKRVDQGSYRCNMSGYDPIKQQSVKLAGSIIPQISFQTASSLSLLRNENLTLTWKEGAGPLSFSCFSQYNKGADFNWVLVNPDGSETKLSFPLNDIRREDTSNSTILVFNKAQLTHTGNYRCSIGQLKSDIKLTVKKARKVMITANLSEVDGVQMIVVECSLDQYDEESLVKTDLFVANLNYIRKVEPPTWKITVDTANKKVKAETTDMTNVGQQDEYICQTPDNQNNSTMITSSIQIRGRRSDTNKVTLSPKSQRVLQNVEFEMVCAKAGAEPSDVIFMFENGTQIINGTKFSILTDPVNTLVARNGISMSESPLKVICMDVATRQNATADVTAELDGCHVDERVCKDGTQCVSTSKFCDGANDCNDKSDEDTDYCNLCHPISKKCESSAKGPPTISHYQVQWQCDGEDDCGNGFDESKCQDFITTKCNDTEYSCKMESKEKKIPRSFVCDQEIDCFGGDDEANCANAQINTINQTNKYYTEGEKVELTCTAHGYPLPRIIWRQNWGCLKDLSRMKVTLEMDDSCQTVTSRLTIDARRGDEGIYNCEAITPKSRAMSDDYTLLYKAP